MKDKKVAEELSTFLTSKGISHELQTNHQTGLISFYTNDKERAEEAFHYFLTAVGLPLPKKMDETDIPRVKIQPITLNIILFCVVLYFAPVDDKTSRFLHWFYFSEELRGFMPEILSGEFWRLITPIFLHFSLLHILFNMLWMKDLGSLIEYHRGKAFYIGFILVTGIVSNFSQYIVAGPRFGGMSGIVYGLLGFLWMNKTLNPQLGYGLRKSDITVIIIWFFLCLFGVIGNVANMAHAGGLSLGMITGIFVTCRERNDINRSKSLSYFAMAIGFFVLTFLIEYLKKYA